MRYTPVELRHVRPARALFGYNRLEIERVFEDVADSFEEVWRERGELADKLEDIEGQLEGVQQRETLLASTLISAERATVDARELAQREAEVIISEAHQEARSIMRTALTERERLFAEARRIETLLRAALGMVEETKGHRADESEAEPPAAPILEWPRREETREFERLSTIEPELVDEPHPDPDPGQEAEAAADERPAQLPPIAEQGAEGDDGPWAGRDFAWG
jgi:cell division septum initiation protein DivIVA